MMQAPTAGHLARAFRSSTEPAIYQKLALRQLDEQRLRRERKEDIASDEAELLDMTMAVISSAEAQEFRIELDSYDTATIEALQENEIRLAHAQAERDEIFAEAHVLPDGRRVFKTKDGLKVFDQNGEELADDIIHADEIKDAKPRWEDAKSAIDRLDAVTRERTEILEYQSKLDEARDQLDEGDMTRKEFDELRNHLKDEMPDAVRQHVAGMEPVLGQSRDAAPSVPGEDLDIPDDMALSPMKLKATVPSFNG